MIVEQFSVNQINLLSGKLATGSTPNLIDAHTAEESFNALLDHFSELKKKEILDKIDHLDGNIQEMAEKVKALSENFTLHDPFLQEDDFDWYALVAVRLGVISSDDFCALMVFKSTLKEPNVTPDNVRVLSLFVDGVLDETVKGLLLSTSDELNEFAQEIFSSMRSHSSLCQKVLLYSTGQENYDLETITGRQAEIGFNIYNFVHLQNEKNVHALVVALPMLRETLKVMRGDIALEMHPVLCLSTVSKLIEDQLLKNSRPIFIPSSLVKEPLQADGFIASYLKFFKHDWYHFLAACMDKTYRDTYLELANFVHERALETIQGSYLRFFCGRLRFNLADLEIQVPKNPNYNELNRFFTHFFRTLQITINGSRYDFRNKHKIASTVSAAIRAEQIVLLSDVMPKLKEELLSKKMVMAEGGAETEAIMSVAFRRFKDNFFDKSENGEISKSIFENFSPIHNFFNNDSTNEIKSDYDKAKQDFFAASLLYEEAIEALYENKEEYIEALQLFDKITSFFNFEDKAKAGSITYLLCALKNNIINYNQFCSGLIWHTMARDFVQMGVGKSEESFEVEICSEMSLEGTYSYSRFQQDMLIDIFRGKLKADQILEIHKEMHACKPNKTERSFFLVLCEKSENLDHLSDFVRSLYEVPYNGKWYRFIPSYTLVNAIFRLKSSKELTFTMLDRNSVIENEYLMASDRLDSTITILGHPVDFKTGCVVNGHPYTPLQHFYHQLEMLIS